MEPTWISERLARTIHDSQISENGGSHGIRDENLFLASLDRPRNLLAYGDAPSLFDLAAAYGYGIAKNHPFIDGNKRTGFVLMAVFLELNGYAVDAPQDEVVATIVRLATDLEDQASISLWLQLRSVKI
ncbi:type II toxin-antitoxin system death-on-curing family toxin [Chamaesiphon sp.]|uniref:type II toxin-antitoxin system death-on-curing family toxin n=1 Tax=Chamaesiphon sp. TaxID=2814140 RepID=UPI003593E8A2